MAITTGFQPVDRGSIPLTRSREPVTYVTNLKETSLYFEELRGISATAEWTEELLLTLRSTILRFS